MDFLAGFAIGHLKKSGLSHKAAGGFIARDVLVTTKIVIAVIRDGSSGPGLRKQA